MACQLTADDLSSGQFMFIVGREHKEFDIHASVVARQSRVLNTFVNGPFREALLQCVVWEHVDIDTFTHFAEFCYAGKYGPDDFGDKPNNSPEDEEPDNYAEDGGPARSKRPRHSYKLPLLGALPRYSTCHRIGNILRHANAHSFSVYYGIDELQTYSLSRLNTALNADSTYPRAEIVLLKLLEYTYEEGPYKDGISDELKALVHRYVAPRLSALWDREELQKLLKNNKLAVSLMAEMVKAGFVPR